MDRLRRALSVLLVVGVYLSVVVMDSDLPPTTASSALAAVANCGAPEYIHNGFQVDRPGGPTLGSKARIEVRPVDLCNAQEPRETFSSTWVMVYNGSGTGWAQIGWDKKSSAPGTQRRFFWQWVKDIRDNPPNVRTFFWGSPENGTFYDFRVSRYPSDGHLHMIRDGSQAPDNDNGIPAETSFDHLNAWNGILSAFSNEVFDRQNDVPGTNSNRMGFRDVQIKNGQNEWVHHDWTGNNGPIPCFYHRNTIQNGHSFQLWTNPIDHSC